MVRSSGWYIRPSFCVGELLSGLMAVMSWAEMERKKVGRLVTRSKESYGWINGSGYDIKDHTLTLAMPQVEFTM